MQWTCPGKSPSRAGYSFITSGFDVSPRRTKRRLGNVSNMPRRSVRRALKVSVGVVKRRGRVSKEPKG